MSTEEELNAFKHQLRRHKAENDAAEQARKDAQVKAESVREATFAKIEELEGVVFNAFQQLSEEMEQTGHELYLTEVDRPEEGSLGAYVFRVIENPPPGHLGLLRVTIWPGSVSLVLSTPNRHPLDSKNVSLEHFDVALMKRWLMKFVIENLPAIRSW